MKYSKINILLILYILSSCSMQKNVIQGVCDKEKAKQQAIMHYNKLNKENYKFKVNQITENNLFYFIEIVIDQEIKENDGVQTMVLGGGCMYTIEKSTCKIIKVKGYE